MPPPLQTADTDGYADVFVAPMAVSGGGATKLGGIAGVTVGEFQVKPLGKGVGVVPALELGIIGPIPSGHKIDGFASINVHLGTALRHRDVFPFVTGGLSRIFVTGTALNFGIGFERAVHGSNKVIRLELRDYYLVTGPRQHLIGLRIALGTLINDSD